MPALSKTPSVNTFTEAWSKRFAQVVKEAAGKDGRLSAKEAARIAQRTDDGRHYADNAVNFLTAKGQKSVSADKLIEAARRYAYATASKAAGVDGRLSAADQQKLPTDLMEDIRALQGKSGPKPPQVDVLGKLTAATAGMYNMSESESPVVAFSGGALGSAPITAQLVALRGASTFTQHGAAMGGGARHVDTQPLAEQPVTEGNPVDFLARRGEVHDPSDPSATEYAAKWAALAKTVGETLTDLRLFRFGTVEATYVLVGRTANGELAGFMTGAVET